MSGDVQLELWLHEYEMAALSSVLEEQGSSVEERMQERFTALYEELVPLEARREIRDRINAERAAQEAELETAREYAALRVREKGADSFFRIGYRETLLDIGRFVRRYLRQEDAAGLDAAQTYFSELTPVTAEQYGQMMEAHLENPNKIVGVFEVDFDRREVSTIGPDRDWRTYSMKDVSAAAYFAYRKSGLGPLQHEARFENKLAGKAHPSAGHLSAREISFADEICEMDGQRLNFYMETGFDVDAVFGTHVCTAENDDSLNIYADYDMTTGQVCDLLEVDLHRADGQEESLEYQLNAVEKRTLLRKMDNYCRQQTGQTLEEYSAQRLSEDGLTPPSQPVM